MPQANPLVIPVLRLLRQYSRPISEYDLMCLLEQDGVVFPVAADTPDLLLFRKHFFLKNALYQLQAELIEDGIYMRIGLLEISLETASAGANAGHLSEAGEARVRDFYLDWRNYSNTGDEDVKQLLQGFWERYFARDQQDQALQVLGLDKTSSWADIQSEYRRLAARHHPDRGGQPSRFMEIRQAYETLRCASNR